VFGRVVRLEWREPAKRPVAAPPRRSPAGILLWVKPRGLEAHGAPVGVNCDPPGPPGASKLGIGMKYGRQPPAHRTP